MAAYKNRRNKRCGYAFEARNREGVLLFRGGSSSGRLSTHLTMQEAVVEALRKAMELNFHRAVIINTDKNLINKCSNLRKSTWQDQAFVMDLNNFHQQGMITQFLVVPRVVIA